MLNRYDIFKRISQGENGEMPEENEKLVRISNVLCSAAPNCGGDEKKSSVGSVNVTEINELEKRISETWA